MCVFAAFAFAFVFFSHFAEIISLLLSNKKIKNKQKKVIICLEFERLDLIKENSAMRLKCKT